MEQNVNMPVTDSHTTTWAKRKCSEAKQCSASLKWHLHPVTNKHCQGNSFQPVILSLLTAGWDSAPTFIFTMTLRVVRAYDRGKVKEPSTTSLEGRTGPAWLGNHWGVVTKSITVGAETLQTNSGCAIIFYPCEFDQVSRLTFLKISCFSIFKKENLLYGIALRVRDNTNKHPILLDPQRIPKIVTTKNVSQNVNSWLLH